MKPRLIFRVLPDRDRGWKVVTPTGVHRMPWNWTKRAVVAWARRRARAPWERQGRLSQLVIHKRNGQIQKGGESTYGHDPKRYES